jgi:hypothetical protein
VTLHGVPASPGLREARINNEKVLAIAGTTMKEVK